MQTKGDQPIFKYFIDLTVDTAAVINGYIRFDVDSVLECLRRVDVGSASNVSSYMLPPSSA
jgi:hypothetical protein